VTAPVFWETDLDAGMVLLQGPGSNFGKADVDHVPSIKFTEVRSSVEGIYGVCGDNRGRMPILLLAGSPPDKPLAFVVPFRTTAPGRLTAVARFLSLQRGKMLPDKRLTPQRRQRLRQLLRTFDARSSGASHRDIAAALFCRHRVAGPDWHESSLRYAVIRLVHDSAALVQGRYRTILHHRGNT
jgi:hypothetical protein